MKVSKQVVNANPIPTINITNTKTGNKYLKPTSLTFLSSGETLPKNTVRWKLIKYASVNKLANKATIAKVWKPASHNAAIIKTLLQKPDNGGKPAVDNIATIEDHAV